ncbi:MAG: hypothetical protein K0Q87_5437, partial [Neobacillus sp.]|nr:hypothetical protein [Neobacillus sp.]
SRSMAILIGSIVAMNVMWLIVLEVTRMSEDQFRNEMLYQTTMSLARTTASNKNKQITCFTGKIQCGKCGYKCSRRNIPHSKTTERASYKRWLCNAREPRGSSSVICIQSMRIY